MASIWLHDELAHSGGESPIAGSAALDDIESVLAYGGQITAVDVQAVSGSFFGLLGVRPALGRVLGPEDVREEAPTVVVL